jgi:ankyrin repeat protein
VNAGADINAKESSNSSPLLRASYNGHIEIVKILVNAGADINAKDNNGKTPLYEAS